MRIALDIDDTITLHPSFFAHLSQSLMSAGHDVIIITFREDRDETARELAAWGIAYSKLLTSSLAACFEHGVYEWKAAMCREHVVDVFFENDPEVLEHVEPPTVCFMPFDREEIEAVAELWRE